MDEKHINRRLGIFRGVGLVVGAVLLGLSVFGIQTSKSSPNSKKESENHKSSTSSTSAKKATTTTSLPSVKVPEKSGTAQIRAVQQRLNELGYNAGAPDGKIGPSFQKAVEAFQKSNGLEQTGDLSPAVIAALNSSVAKGP